MRVNVCVGGEVWVGVGGIMSDYVRVGLGGLRCTV